MRTSFLAMSVLIASAAGVHAQQRPLPLKLAPRPTSAAITEQDLMTRLYIFADDSMMGRQMGRIGNMRGTDYIARELRRLGIEPGGDNGSYFQRMPSVLRKYEDWSSISVDGRKLGWNTDFVAVPGLPPRLFNHAEVIFGGTVGDTTVTPQQAADKIIVFVPAAPGAGGAGRAGRGGGGGGGRGGPQPPSPATRYASASAIATVDLDGLNPAQRAFINNPMTATDFTRIPIQDSPQGRGGGGRGGAQQPAGLPPVSLRLTRAAAAALFGRSIEGLTAGTTGKTVLASLAYIERQEPEYARNVIGIIRGRDPALRGQFVAIGAHPDHVGFTVNPVDHDSAKAYAQAILEATMVGNDFKRLTPEERAAIKVNLDSIRKLRPARRDSIRNGADDDGSGSMAVLEIAEAVSRMQPKPRRSIIFVWHNGEERGLLGSNFFTQYTTIPRDSIVAQINLDMIGRGRANDIPGGGPDYLAVVGAKRLSSDLGQMVEASNQKQKNPLKLDYRFDQAIDPEGPWSAYNNIYGRSDHANYSRFGIPIAFFFTGLHADYHQPTDEPQYIDYPHYTRITNYIRDLLLDVANRDKRPAVDKPIT
jgi:hypothetical protein